MEPPTPRALASAICSLRSSGFWQISSPCDFFSERLGEFQHPLVSDACLPKQRLALCVQSGSFLFQLISSSLTSGSWLQRLEAFWHKTGRILHSFKDSKVMFRLFWIFPPASNKRHVSQRFPSTARLQSELWQYSFRVLIHSTSVAERCNGFPYTLCPCTTPRKRCEQILSFPYLVLTFPSF